MTTTPREDRDVFVAVDIGCIECGEDSAVLGVFTSRSRARRVADKARAAQQENWHGQHDFRVFKAKFDPARAVPAYAEDPRP